MHLALRIKLRARRPGLCVRVGVRTYLRVACAVCAVRVCVHGCVTMLVYVFVGREYVCEFVSAGVYGWLCVFVRVRKRVSLCVVCECVAVCVRAVVYGLASLGVREWSFC